MWKSGHYVLKTFRTVIKGKPSLQSPFFKFEIYLISLFPHFHFCLWLFLFCSLLLHCILFFNCVLYGIVCTVQLCAISICLVCSCICRLQAKTNFRGDDKVLISSHLLFLITLSKPIVPGYSKATRPFEQILPVGLNIKFSLFKRKRKKKKESKKHERACSSSAAAVLCGWTAGGRSPAHCALSPVCLPQVTATSAWGTRRTSLSSSRPSSSTSRSRITSPIRLQVWMFVAACDFPHSHDCQHEALIFTWKMNLHSVVRDREHCTFTSAKMNGFNLAARKGLF